MCDAFGSEAEDEDLTIILGHFDPTGFERQDVRFGTNYLSCSMIISFLCWICFQCVIDSLRIPKIFDFFILVLQNDHGGDSVRHGS